MVLHDENIDSGSIRGRVGVDLGSIKGRVGVDLGPIRGRVGVDQGSMWGVNQGVILHVFVRPPGVIVLHVLFFNVACFQFVCFTVFIFTVLPSTVIGRAHRLPHGAMGPWQPLNTCWHWRAACRHHVNAKSLKNHSKHAPNNPLNN